MDTAAPTFDPAPEPPRPPAHSPQLRTLLLTDLVDSTSLVERLGDAPASELFRAHDRLVLQLQQQWRGRLIDRSDGLLLLFERPIDGLGFALDYARGLIELGKARNLELRARAGLHVGEVLTWRNSDEAVSIGAKPLEVEGLAKPIAARLMAMARPGQILLSAVAEPLAHRAARELGERGQLLAWKSWGRWRFKGLPEPQQVFEVGEPGIAPLRAPPNTPKAWRDIPLWRRPAALAAEVALLAGAALGVWFITRPEPAIAFNQRDWVVVGDLRNLTGQSALDDSLEQAFRISLEQSRYVNVLSDLKTRDTLGRMRRMRRTPDAVLDRATASEIALRDGARAVILPTVAEVGGRVRVTAEVIDPYTQATVYTQTADGRGIDSTLDSIDKVTASLRTQLGEALPAIERDSKPLPQVTTRNLDALRAYALGQQAFGASQYTQARDFYQRAATLDPQFALAHLGLLRAYNALVQLPRGVPHLQRAAALRDRLPGREQMYVEAWLAQVGESDDVLAKWQLMAKLYPDFFPASANVGYALYAQNRFREALPYARRGASPQADFPALSWDLVARLHLGLEEFGPATTAVDKALALGATSSQLRRVDVLAAQRRFEAAARAWEPARAEDPLSFEGVSLAIEQARFAAARDAAKQALAAAAADDELMARTALLPLAIAAWADGDTAQALVHANEAADRALTALAAAPDGADAGDDAYLAIAAGLLAQRAGDEELPARLIERLPRFTAALSGVPVQDLFVVLRARQMLQAGDAAGAVKLLDTVPADRQRFQSHVARMEAQLAAGRHAAAVEAARWLAGHRGHAYIEQGTAWCLQPLNVFDTTAAQLRMAELFRRNGQEAEAAKALAAFDRAWPVARLPDYLRSRRVALDAASN